MKFLVLTLLISQGAFAAKWQKVDSKDSIFANLISKTKVYSVVYKKVSSSNTATEIQELKQLTYIVRALWGDYSMPEFVTLSKTNQLDVLLQDDSRTEPAPMKVSFLNDLKDFVQTNEVSTFSGVDGNSFGDCANLYLSAKKTSETAIFSVCYAE